MAIKKIGKKGREWIRAKSKLIKIYREKGITRGENCGSRVKMSFHHRPSRASQEAEHTFEKTRLLCWECHPFFEHNEEADKKLFVKPRGYDPKNKIDIMAEKKSKSKKVDWQRPHKCFHCRTITSMIICHSCGKTSIKKVGK